MAKPVTKVDSDLIGGVKGIWGLDLSDFLLSQLSYHKITLAPNTFGSSSCRKFFLLEKWVEKPI